MKIDMEYGILTFSFYILPRAPFKHVFNYITAGSKPNQFSLILYQFWLCASQVTTHFSAWMFSGELRWP